MAAGLMTGAGAAAGLEKLFERMRADQLLENQGRAIDLDEWNAQATDRYRNAGLAENTRQFDAAAPVRESTARQMNATAGATEAGTPIIEQRAGILKGLFGNEGAQPKGTTTPVGSGGGTPDGTSAVRDGSMSGLNNPEGRLRLSVADISPNDVFGPVNTSNSGDEQLMDAYWAKLNGADPTQSTGKGATLTFDQRVEALKNKPATAIAQGNLDIRRGEATVRKQLYDLRIKSAEASLNQIPPLQRSMALAEFQNRLQHDIQGPGYLPKWLGGEDVADPSAQIEAIAADIIGKYGAAPNPGTGNPPPRRNPVYNPATGRAE